MTCFDSSNCVGNVIKGASRRASINSLNFLCLLTLLAGNIANDCFRMGDTSILGGLVQQTYIELSWKVILSLAGCCVVLNITLKCWKYNSNSVDTSEPQDSTTDADADASQDSSLEAASTLELMGEDSVYRFFLTKSWWCWGIALVTVAAQIGMCYIFVQGSEYEFALSISDLKYAWKCPPDLIGCRNTMGMRYVLSDVFPVCV